MDHCLIPVSIGELFDKYSILQIKKERITDITKIELIQKEMNYLTPFIEKYSSYMIMKSHPFLIEEIKCINEQLWDVEEKIRLKEVDLNFDDEFINLARNVYKKNDKRCQIKNKINTLFNSDIKEIKSYV
jgi:hypothetical protein